MSNYLPELGQMAFGQPWQPLEPSKLLLAVLEVLSEAWEESRPTEGNPFSNSGNRFDGNEFSAHAYSWADDEQEFNFKYRDLRVSWYKYLGRGTSCNMKPGPEFLAEMLGACLTEIRGESA